jgi:predicted nucleic acid-binding Zn ribbon protein
MATLGRLLIVLFLAGCSSETPVNHMADSIRNELSLIAEDVYMLPPECGDQSKLAQRIEMARERIDIMEETYINETCVLVNEKRRFQRYTFILFWALTVLIALWVKRLLTRVVQ